MSIDEVKKIITLMLEDEVFENEVFKNPDKALSGFNLSDEEKTRFSTLDKEKLKQIAMNLDKRVSKDESWWVDSVVD